MFIELVEVLRCVREHDESSLVASIKELDDRSIRSGTLGCPVCGAEYRVRDGVVIFSSRQGTSRVGSADPSEMATQAGGLLGLTDGPGLAILGGTWAISAEILSDVTGARIIALNAPPGVMESQAVGLVTAEGALPVGEESCAGIALDDSFGADAARSAARALRRGSRLVLPRKLELPAGMTLLASDESYAVLEKAAEVTPLRRARR